MISVAVMILDRYLYFHRRWLKRLKTQLQCRQVMIVTKSRFISLLVSWPMDEGKGSKLFKVHESHIYTPTR